MTILSGFMHSGTTHDPFLRYSVSGNTGIQQNQKLQLGEPKVSGSQASKQEPPASILEAQALMPDFLSSWNQRLLFLKLEPPTLVRLSKCLLSIFNTKSFLFSGIIMTGSAAPPTKPSCQPLPDAVLPRQGHHWHQLRLRQGRRSLHPLYHTRQPSFASIKTMLW